MPARTDGESSTQARLEGAAHRQAKTNDLRSRLPRPSPARLPLKHADSFDGARLCREIDPDNWQALDSRVRRAMGRKRGDTEAAGAARHTRQERAKSVLRNADDEQVKEIVRDLPRGQRERLIDAYHLAETDRCGGAAWVGLVPGRGLGTA